MKKIKLDIQKFASGVVSLGTSGAMEGRVVWSSTVMGNTPEEKASLNKSLVTATVQVRRTSSWTQGDFTGNVVINGVSEEYSTNVYITTDWVTVKDNYSKEVPHNVDGTRTTQVGGTVTGPAGTSLEGVSVSNSILVTLDTIPRYATCNQSVNDITETTIKMDWSSDSTCDYLWYSKNNGSSWTAVGSINATRGTYTISGLTPETQYNIKTRVRRKDSQLTTDSYTTGVTTYNYPTLGGGSNFIIGESPLIQMNNPMKRPLEISIIAEDNTTVKVINTDGTNNTLRPTFTTAENNLFYASIPNKKTGTYKIKTVSSVNTNTKNARQYTVNENDCKPTFNDFTYADTNATTTALTGNNQIVVQNYSNVQATVSTSNKATANKSASMVKYNLVIGDKTNSVNYSDNASVNVSINNAPSNVIKLYAEDSRGLTKPVTKTLDNTKYKAYTPIQRGDISVVRTGNVGTECTLSYDGTLWGQSFGSVTNTGKSARYRYKKTNEDWPQTWNGTTTITPTTSGNNYSFSNIIAGDLGNSGFSAEYSFNIEVEVFDELSSTVFSFTLGTGIPHIAIADEGIAIKQPYNTTTGGALQVNGDLYVNGNKILPTEEKHLYHRGDAPSNLNSAITHGIYQLVGSHTNAPVTGSIYGILIVYESRGLTWIPSSQASWVWQTAIDTSGRIFRRYGINSSTMTSWEYDGNINKYSTSEIISGTWHNGKPIYRKTFTFGETSGNSKSISLGNISIADIVSINGSYKTGTYDRIPISVWYSNAYNCATTIKLNTQTIEIAWAGWSKLLGGSITIEYTKTTD